MSAEAHRALSEGMTRLGLGRPDWQRAAARYLDLLQRWNRVSNLTGTRDASGLVRRHLLDCLAVAPHLDAGPVLDLGAGAGLPGILLAIVHPELEFTLLDSAGKKTRFMTQARIELGLDNVEVVQARVEELPGELRFARVVTRAFAPVLRCAELAGPRLAPGGRLLFMQAQPDEAAVRKLEAVGWYTEQRALEVPGLDEPRHLLLAGVP